MKLVVLAISALSLVSLAAAQNGNDRAILNNRTGLAPAVYSSFTTSYTTCYPPAYDGVSASITPVPTLVPPSITATSSFNCSRQRVSRGGGRLAPCASPSGFFSKRPCVHFSGTNIVFETGTGCVNILPIPTPFIIGDSKSVPPHSQPSTTNEDLVSMLPITSGTSEGSGTNLPIPTSLLGGDPPTSSVQQSNTDESRLSILPIISETRSQYVAPSSQPSKTDWGLWSVLPIYSSPASAPATLPTKSLHGPIQRHSSLTSDTASYSAGCDVQKCSSEMPVLVTASPCAVAPSSAATTTHESTTSSHFAIPPALVRRHATAGVPIDWWRGPGKNVVVDVSEVGYGPEEDEPVSASHSGAHPTMTGSV